jgi:acyl-coenzyme A synthetase/AMP-(fatty) acid ligase
LCSRFQNGARSATIGSEFGSYLGNVGYGFIWTVILPSMAEMTVEPVRLRLPDLDESALLVGTPRSWAHWVPDRSRAAALGGATGIVSAGPMPAARAAVLRDLPSLAALVEVYGSTETGAIGYRSDRGGYSMVPWYRLDGEMLHRDDGSRVEPPDALARRDDGTFDLLGRKDAVVSVAGVNVNLGRVRTVLEHIPQAREVRIRARHDDANGYWLDALLVADPENRDTAVAAAQDIARRHLKAPERPGAYTVLDRVPVSSMGKDLDWRTLPRSGG